MRGSYLGPGFDDAAIEAALRAAGAVWERLPEDELIDRAARLLAGEQVVGWFQGRMEFGPRALGARSILGDPRSPRMQSVLNLKIKYRESFRPFAPSVLREHVRDWFELDVDSPYMLLVAPVQPARRLRADAGAGAPLRHREAERSALGDPGGDARRLVGAHPDRARGDEPALPRCSSSVSTRSRDARYW